VHIKTAVRGPCQPLGWLLSKQKQKYDKHKTEITGAGKGVKKLETLCILGEKVKQ
jgi:hypothetical protein